MQMVDSVGFDYIPSHTCRMLRSGENLTLVAEWAELLDRDKLLNHPAAVKFSNLIDKAPFVSDSSLVLFRGRYLTVDAPRTNQMGPPETTTDSRYAPGQPVLYLSDSEKGVNQELDAYPQEGVRYLQRYRLPFDQLRIRDFTKFPPDDFLTAVFSKAEECNLEGYGIKSCTFSQTVAGMVATNSDGMRVPGVRGNRDFSYSNVVVFQPFPAWPKWLEPDSTPYRLSPQQ